MGRASIRSRYARGEGPKGRALVTVITLLLANGVECDLERITTKYPKGEDGRDVSVREIATESKRLAAQLTDMLARRRAEKNEARARRLAKKDPASNKRTESFA